MTDMTDIKGNELLSLEDVLIAFRGYEIEYTSYRGKHGNMPAVNLLLTNNSVTFWEDGGLSLYDEDGDIIGFDTWYDKVIDIEFINDWIKEHE